MYGVSWRRGFALLTEWLTISVAFAGLFREVGLEFSCHALKFLGVCRRVALDGNIWPFWRVFRIDFEPLFEAWLGIGLDRINRAFRLANATIDAFIGVNDQHVFALVEAIHGADFNAVHIFAFNAVIIDDVGHDGPVVLYNERGLAIFLALCTVFFVA